MTLIIIHQSHCVPAEKTVPGPCLQLVQVDMLSEADKDHDGLLSEDEWSGVELWFQYRAFQPGSEEDLEAEHAEVDKEALKKEAFDRWGLSACVGCSCGAENASGTLSRDLAVFCMCVRMLAAGHPMPDVLATSQKCGGVGLTGQAYVL